MKTLLGILLALSLAFSASAATTANDAACDIAVLPAATLLLPYFEVDLDTPGGTTTLFTITNVTNADAIARVTLWTDRGYPVLTFNVLLTGYDVQPLNLYDILGRGSIAPPGATARGRYSDSNPDLDSTSCALGGQLPETDLARVQSAFTTGTIDGACNDIGGVHENAAGYATIDVVGNCSANTPRDRDYWRKDLRHDNILLGDYQELEDGRAQGGPLVHIRAVPGDHRTFYARYTDRDGRQPLPSQFAARWTEGTSLKIWREGRAGFGATCDDYAADENLDVADVVVFDDQENAAEGGRIELAASTKTGIDDPLFPRIDGTNGWIYLNLDRSRRDDFASQAWVISSTDADGDVDAVALANGCAAPAESGAKIAPASDADHCDIALRPAATLLLPYFEVDLEDPQGENTIFTITNAGAQDRIARVTLWTDYTFPVLTFNVRLTGYDVQSIDLYEAIKHGTLPRADARGPFSDRNFGLDLGECGPSGEPLSEALLLRMESAFVHGTVPDLGTQSGCNNAGTEHENAVGYATVDVVRNCADNGPLSEEYWSKDLSYDNVLIGDYRQVRARDDVTRTSTLVHIRAVPDADFPRTFYGRYTDRDARQPLPALFAARWVEGTFAGFETDFKIWREGRTGRDATCSRWDDNVLPPTEIVRFDENENAVGSRREAPVFPPCDPGGCHDLTAAMLIPISDASYIPPLPNGAPAGWLYLNLDHDEVGGYAAPWASQNWVVVSMRAGTYSVDFDAAALGNGCSAQVAESEVVQGTEVIGPRP